MAIKLTCICGHSWEVDETLTGKVILCSECNQSISVHPDIKTAAAQDGLPSKPVVAPKQPVELTAKEVVTAVGTLLGLGVLILIAYQLWFGGKIGELFSSVVVLIIFAIFPFLILGSFIWLAFQKTERIAIRIIRWIMVLGIVAGGALAPFIRFDTFQDAKAGEIILLVIIGEMVGAILGYLPAWVLGFGKVSMKP